MQDIRVLISKLVNLVKGDIWRIHVDNLPRIKAFLIRQLRVFLLVIRKSREDKCPLRASGLTFYSLLSIVPVVTLALGIAKGFGFEKLVEKQLLEKFSSQEEVVIQIINFAHSLLENTRGGLLAGIGIVVLFWAVIKVLSHIERSFGDIWEIKKTRTFGRKASDYLSTALICPILIIVSSSVTVFITTRVTLIAEKVALFGILSPLIFFTLKLLPYCLIWILFSFIYILMPNTKVNLGSGFLAGVVAGTIYQIVQWAYITFQVGVANYNAIYGSFAVLPLFLIWLQVSWLIVLFGAEISFAHQNVDSYEFEPDCLRVSAAYKKLLSLQISHLVIRNFSKGEKPLTALQISQTSGIPIRLVGQILQELIESGIFSGTQSQEPGELGYLPARDINILTIKFILEALEDRGANNMLVAQTKELNVLSEALQAFRDVIGRCPANRLLKDI